MNNEAEFLRIYNLPGLRKYVLDIVWIFTKDEELQKELIQEAWLRIWQADENCGIRYYEREAYRAIDNYYRKEMRQQRLKNSAIRKRLYRRRRKMYVYYGEKTSQNVV